jgi:lipoprotein-anchoring transpeptidase ErfK/SrfK
MRLSACLRHCRLLAVAALGAVIAFAASAQTGSESQAPSPGTTGSESQTPSPQTPSPGTTGPESQTPSTVSPKAATQSESQGAPNRSNLATQKPNSVATTTQPRKAVVPDILIVVNKPAQTMTVTVDGHVRYRWRVSTGATHYSTPDGSYTPFRMELMHYSREWDNAGMPHAIFFTQRGHSIHGSDHPGLGTAVSHGCVRLTLANAATLYQLVKSVGMTKTRVVVSGRDPPGYRVPTMPPGQPVGLFGGFFHF